MIVKNCLRKFDRNASRSFHNNGTDSLFVCFVLLLFGLFLGSMASGSIFYNSHNGVWELLIHEVVFVLLLLFLSTSYLGAFLIPLLFVVKGFLSSAFICSCFVYTGVFTDTIFLEVIPFFIMLPFAMLLAGDCTALSYQVLQRRFGIISPPVINKTVLHVLLCVLFLFIDFFYCTYIIPLVIV